MPKKPKINIECIHYLLEEGFNQNEISKLCEVSRQAVSYMLKYKPKMPNIKMKWFCITFLRRLGFTKPEISSLMNVTINYVDQILIKKKLLKQENYYSNYLSKEKKFIQTIEETKCTCILCSKFKSNVLEYGVKFIEDYDGFICPTIGTMLTKYYEFKRG